MARLGLLNSEVFIYSIKSNVTGFHKLKGRTCLEFQDFYHQFRNCEPNAMHNSHLIRHARRFLECSAQFIANR